MGELKKEAVYISRGVESAGTDYLKKLNDEESRITYVDESGKVIYDNEADVESMDNHGHRKEIREAEINGEGADERMSSTLSEKTMYYAVRLENGNAPAAASIFCCSSDTHAAPVRRVCIQAFREGCGTS